MTAAVIDYVVATPAETAAAMATIVEALTRNYDEIERVKIEISAAQQQRQAADEAERASVLAARRGDAAAQKVLADATANVRRFDDELRHLAQALDELNDERQELARQKTESYLLHIKAERAAKARQRLDLARELDAAFAVLGPKIVAWRKLSNEIVAITLQLKESEGRRVHDVVPDVLAHHLREAAPEIFDQTQFLRHTCFSSVSERFTEPEPEVPAIVVEEGK